MTRIQTPDELDIQIMNTYIQVATNGLYILAVAFLVVAIAGALLKSQLLGELTSAVAVTGMFCGLLIAVCTRRLKKLKIPTDLFTLVFDPLYRTANQKVHVEIVFTLPYYFHQNDPLREKLAVRTDAALNRIFAQISTVPRDYKELEDALHKIIEPVFNDELKIPVWSFEVREINPNRGRVGTLQT